MKFLIFVSSVLAAATAGWAPSAYYGQHIPVIGPNGVPVETPEVQAAKAHHFAAHAEASARSGHYGYFGAAPLVHAYGVPGAVTHDGHPLDTPEVAAAKVQHYADYAVAAQRNGVHVAPIVQVGAGLPIDTPEVQLAKAAHFAAHAAARNGLHYRKRRSLYPQHIPVIGPNGVPVETPEVQAAKANHFAALAEASVRSGAIAPVPVHYSAGYGAVPVISNGVPVDTPEVQAAKAHHFAAHAAARGGYAVTPYAGAWIHQPQAVIGHDGQPVETPEVQLAKAAHFAAHSAAARQYYY